MQFDCALESHMQNNFLWIMIHFILF